MDHAAYTQLVASARANHGVLLPAALILAGVTARQRRIRLDRGEWRQLVGGVCVVAAMPETMEMWVTAVLAAYPTAVLSHHSAAWLHRLDGANGELPVNVIASGRSTAPKAGVRVVRRMLDPADITQRRGWKVTSIERTLFDLCSVWPEREVRRAIEDAVAARRTTMERLESFAGRTCRSGVGGAARFGKLLDELGGEAPVESELEARFVEAVVAAQLPMPARQVVLGDRGAEIGRVDFCWEAERLIAELDGRKFHTRSAAFERDRRRDQQAAVAGYRTLRFTWRQVVDDPSGVVAVIRALLCAEGDR